MTRIDALGVVIRNARTRRNISQENLAASAKLHRNALGRIERGEVGLNINSLWLLADVLGMPASELVLQAEILANSDSPESNT